MIFKIVVKDQKRTICIPDLLRKDHKTEHHKSHKIELQLCD